MPSHVVTFNGITRVVTGYGSRRIAGSTWRGDVERAQATSAGTGRGRSLGRRIGQFAARS